MIWMLTVIAARKTGGVFSPSLALEDRGTAEIFYLKNRRSLKKLKKLGLEKALSAPSASEMTAGMTRQFVGDQNFAIRQLPRIMAGLAELPVGELYLSMKVARAAEIIDICAGCAKLFTVVTRETGGQELFDGLYFDKGVIMRRVSTPASRVGATALCLTENGRTPPGVMSLDLNRLGRLSFYGGPLDFLEAEHGISPTAELYELAGLPLPEKGRISKDYGDKILYLDTGTIM